MGDSTNTLFIEMAVAKGYVNRAHAEEALSIQLATAPDGDDRRQFLDILVEEGWMTREQVAEIQEQIENGSTHTGRIAGYKVLAKIGAGGMGTVYKAQNETTGELAALKVLPRRMAQKGDFVERFLREARAASSIESEHIVKIVDVGLSGGYHYLAMEYVEGESVDTTISIDGVVDERKALGIIHQIAHALRDAEAAHMVHRDIKPGNIIITEEGVAKLTDFGLARETADNSMTQVGMTLGTPNYMSPEQAKAVRSLDVRSDIYSLGVTFYHMLTGVVPFHGETSMLTMLKHLNEEPVAPMTRRDTLSKGCNDVVLKMLAKSRRDRYQTAEHLITDLALVMEGKPPQFAAPPAAAPTEPATVVAPRSGSSRFAEEIHKYTRVRWIKVGVTAFLILLAAIVITVGFSGGSKTPPKDPGDDKPRLTPFERDARAALDDAKRYAARNPDKLSTLIARFTAVEEKFGTSSVGDEAQRLRLEAQRKFDAAVGAALERCATAAEAAAEEGRFSDALAAYDRFPEALATPAAAERIRAAQDALRRRAEAREREARAAELFARAKQQTANRARTAQTLWELVRGYADTVFYSRTRPEIEAMLIDAETGHLSADSFLAAKPVALGSGQSELRYDFRDARQAADWSSVWRGRTVGRWPARAAYGEMTAEAGLVYFKMPLWGEFHVELRAKDLRAASVRFGMPEPVAPPQTNGIAFDWKRSGTGAVSSISRAGKRLGAERRFARFRVVGAVSIVIEARAGTLTIRTDDKVAHRVKLPAAATDGYLALAGFNQGARLTGVTVRVRFDRDRIRKELIEPIREAEAGRIRWAMAPRLVLLKGADAGRWTLSAPKHWTFAEGYASAAARVDARMTAGEAAWNDYVFSTTTRLGAAPKPVRLLFRWTEGTDKEHPRRGYYLELRAGNPGQPGKLALRRATGNETKTLAERPLELTDAEWYDVAVEARGSRLRALVRGQEVLRAEDTTYRAGGIGLASLGAGARFSEIAVKVAK